MITPVVYIASPYTAGDVLNNVAKQNATVDRLMSLGCAPLAPLLFHYVNEVYPHTWEEWMRVCIPLVRKADIVLRLPGESPGADMEVVEAHRAGIDIVHFGHSPTPEQSWRRFAKFLVFWREVKGVRLESAGRVPVEGA